MNPGFLWPLAPALAAIALAQTAAQAAYTNQNSIIITNGVVLITTRSAQDGWFHTQGHSSLWDADDNRGPGCFSPGDAAMGELLQDNGYTVRMVPEKVLDPSSYVSGTCVDWYGNPIDPLQYYNGGNLPSGTATSASNVLYSAMLVIMSGSGASSDFPPPNTLRIPIIAGDATLVGDTTSPTRDHGEIFLWHNYSGGSLTLGYNPGLYMRVVATNHPIMQGIPLDTQGRVQIFRAPYPQENQHSANSSKPNYELGWLYVNDGQGAGPSVPAGGLTIIGRLDSKPNYVVFAAMEAGGAFAPCDTSDPGSPWYGYTNAPSRLVQFFVNEGGSGNSRRAFNCLTDIGRVIFVRTCKWAMGETLTPYQPLGLIKVSLSGSHQLKLTWTGCSTKNYKVLGTRNLFGPPDFSNWQTVAQDIPGAERD